MQCDTKHGSPSPAHEGAAAPVATTHQLLRAADRVVLFTNLEIAQGFWQRFWGWQFRKQVAADTALLIEPCHSIHTCCMRFSIDVAFLDADYRVLRVAKGLRPWRMMLPVRGSRRVLECAAGSLHLAPGEQVLIVECPLRDASSPENIPPTE